MSVISDTVSILDEECRGIHLQNWRNVLGTDIWINEKKKRGGGVECVLPHTLNLWIHLLFQYVMVYQSNSISTECESDVQTHQTIPGPWNQSIALELNHFFLFCFVLFCFWHLCFLLWRVKQCSSVFSESFFKMFMATNGWRPWRSTWFSNTQAWNENTEYCLCSYFDDAVRIGWHTSTNTADGLI